MLGPVTSVYAAVASRTTLAEDDTHLTCWHEGGALSILTASSLVAAPGPRLRILGTRAAYVLAAVGGEPHVGADLAVVVAYGRLIKPDLLARLRGQHRGIWVVGGGAVCGDVLRRGLADEVRYSIVPIAIGDGVPDRKSVV